MKNALPGLFVSSLACLSACESQAQKRVEPPAPESSHPTAAGAITAGLDWLTRHQAADGSWRASAVDAACNASFETGPTKTNWTDHFDVGSTALCLLAFVRAGDHSAAPGRALDWLHAQQNEQGFFEKDRSFLYNDAIAALALVEHYAASRDAKEIEPAQRAVDFLQRAQRPSPSGNGAWGWRYNSRMEIEQKFGADGPTEMQKKELYDSDVSVTSWAAAALLAARQAGLKVDPASLEGAAEFVRWCRGREGFVGYNDPKNAGLTVQGRNDHFVYHPTCMSSIGLRFALELDPNPADAFIEAAAERIAKDAPAVSADGLSIDYYYWLHGSQALAAYDHARNPRYFQAWKRVLGETLLGLQDQKPSECGRGGWLVPDRWSYAAGPVYTTAMALLALEEKG